MSIFPSSADIENVISQTTQNTELPLFKEYAWDFSTNDFIYNNGKNVIVEGKEALKVWIYKTLKTKRYEYFAYTWDYGNELDTLIGQKYSAEYVSSEVERLLKECLLINHYIKELTDITAISDGRTLKIEFTANTVYGEVDISV